MARKEYQTLTEQMYYLLMVLMHPHHGYEIMQMIEQVSEGRIHMGAGTLYTLLSRFEADGYIRKVKEEERRKIYQLTQQGYALWRGEYERLQRLVIDGKKLYEGSEEL